VPADPLDSAFARHLLKSKRSPPLMQIDFRMGGDCDIYNTSANFTIPWRYGTRDDEPSLSASVSPSLSLADQAWASRPIEFPNFGVWQWRPQVPKPSATPRTALPQIRPSRPSQTANVCLIIHSRLDPWVTAERQVVGPHAWRSRCGDATSPFWQTSSQYLNMGIHWNSNLLQNA
jgi:hypothetical protein